MPAPTARHGGSRGGAVRYEFVVDGELAGDICAEFPELARSGVAAPGTTALFGPLEDYTAMRSVLARIDALGLTLIEMRRLPD
ncbi:hypothetical protein C5E45_03895 [Nocardia nova]|uniref:Uncharacterized protein n=1 Tax=Nocardia nova TaxID=37330 RepID=A0A2S6AWH3_9NOCA|nr:hypothetical protein C5E41_02815 [Nocardia nova]PPJ39559.1 hypothetical protein C5E45_03895 [Nocardia nova]